MRSLIGWGWMFRCPLFQKNWLSYPFIFFLFSATIGFSQNRAEYFFDTDPGVGLGQTLSMPVGDSVVFNHSVSIISLSAGFHTLYIRTRMNGRWSLPSSSPFFIQSLSSLNTGPITALEYFFDTDPGVGNGTRLSVSPAVDSSVRSAVIPVGSLASGFHTLFVRAQSNAGYSLTAASPFFIVSSATLNSGPLTSLEYFFDSDPGPGAGTRINLSPSADSVDRTAVVPITGLSAGFHTLYIRSKNNFGYSQTEARTFFVVSGSTFNVGPINRMEYFIDTDPGPGNGFPFPSFTASDSVDRNFVLTMPSSLGQGSHKLYIRSQNSDKRWSLTEVKDFTVDCGEIFIQAANNPICPSQGTVLSPTLGLSGDFQWYRNNLLIAGATSSTFFASQAGSYTLSYSNGSCADTSDALVLTETTCPSLPGSGNAPTFSGGNSVITFPQGPVTAYTIECWVRFTGNPANRSLVVHTLNGPFSNWSHQIRTNAQGQFVHYTAVPGAINTQGSTVAQQNQWYHVAITASNGGQGRLYVNGIAEGTPFNISSLWASGAEFQIGSGSAGAGLDQAASPIGQIDEVRIWNTEMTQAQIRDRMCRKITAADPFYSNLVRYFNFDETSGTTSINLTNPTITANWVNNPTRGTSGAPIGNQSVAAYVSAGLPTASLQFNGQDNLAVTYTGGTFTGSAGTHIYAVSEKPNTEAGIDNPGTNNRYFGVFNVNLSNPQYTAVYNYNGNPFVTTANKPNLALFKRTDNSFSPWANAGAANNTTANTLTVTGQSTEYMIGVATSAITAGAIGNNQSVECATSPPDLLENLVSATTTSGNPITYQWQDSTAGGNWQNISGATSATFQPPFLTASRWYRRRAIAGVLSAFSNQVEILVQQAIAGDPAVFPLNAWNVYGYNGGDLNLGSGTSYRGFYSVNTLNINTQNQWGGNASPSAASNYQGCTIQNDNFTFVLKRKGFPTGNYLLNIVDHDDNIRVYLDGNLIFEHLGCCDPHSNITLGKLDENSTLEVRVQEGVGFAQVNLTFVESDLQPGAIASSQSICNSGTPSAFTNTQSAFGGPSLTISYQWQDSTAGGSWQNISGAVNTTFQPGNLTETTWFRRVAFNGNQQAISNEVQVSVSSVVGDPSIFPMSQWHMYAYSGGDFNLGSFATYLGFYPIATLNVNSADQWNVNASPSSAPGYQGCPVPNDNFIFTLKRRGFPAGQYTMNILAHDDWVRVLVDGVQVFEHLSCCDTHNGIDLGTLGANSTIEVRTLEGGGSAQIAFELITTDFQGGAIAADQTICSGKAPAAFTSISEAFGGGATNITYQWQDSTAGGSWQNIANATGLGFQAGTLSANRWYRRRAQSGSLTAFSNELAVTVLPNPSVSISPAGPITLCAGEIAELNATASPGTTLRWLRNGAVVNGQTSASLFVTQSGSYRAVALVGNGQCTDTSQAVVVNVNPKPSPELNLSGPQSICSNGSLVLTHTNPQSGQTNQWKRDGSPIAGGSSITLTQPGFYYLVSTITATGCKDSTQGVTLNVINTTLSPAGPIQICQGSSTNLTATNVGTATLRWLRNDVEISGANGQILSASLAGVYKVVADLPGLCSDTSNGVTVIVNPLPQANISADADSFCVGGTTVLRANTGSGLSYQWKRNGSNLANANADTLLVNAAGTYTVEVRNAANCPQLSNEIIIRQVNNIAWFIDADGDGFGNGNAVQSCARPTNGFLPNELIATNGDCNDNDATINPNRQFLTFSPTNGFVSQLASPLVGTPYTSFRFEAVYTDLNNNPAPVTFPRVILDYEGNGQFNNPNDRTILMQASDPKDNNTSDGKLFFATVNSLPPGQAYTTRVVSGIGLCAATIGPFNYPDVFIQSDLQIFANDIVFDNPNPNVSSPLQISATIHNVSDFAAQNFVVRLVNEFDTTIVYPDIVVSNLAAQSSQVVTWNIITPSVPAWCPMRVSVDYTNVIQETNESDNTAVRPFVNGPFNVPGNIQVQPSVVPSVVVGVSGASVTLTGTAIYTETAIPLTNPSVAGAQVSFTVTPGGQSYTTYTNSFGQINFGFFVPLTPGVYTISGTITDFTLTSNFTLTFTVVPPVCLPDLVTTLSLSSTNIVEGESITGSVRIRNVGCEPVLDSTLTTFTQSGGTPFIPNEKIPPLAVNAFYDVTLPAITFSSPGTFSICATADGAFEVQEQSEFNTDCRLIQVIPFLPDIFPSFCGVGGGSIYLSNQVFTHTFGFANSGGSSTGPFTVRIIRFLNGNPLDTFDHAVQNLARQSQGSVSINVTYDQTGVYTYQMECDNPIASGGVVTETNETNNTTICSITVLPPQVDLFVSGCGQFEVDPVNPAFPGNITLKARVGNSGNLTANPPILVRFSRSSGSVDDVILTEPLAPGQSVLISKVVAATAPATDTARVTIDPNNVFTEFTKVNNSYENTLCHESAPVDNICGTNWWSGTYLKNQAIFLNVPVLVRGMYKVNPLKVRFFVSGPGLTGTLNLGDAIMNNLTENCSCPYIATLPVNFAFPEEGEYIFTFVTDPDNEYTECNENNNTLVRRVKVSGLPDLRVLSQYINPSKLNPDVGEPITIQGTYENIGLSNIDQTLKFKLLVDEVPVDSAIVNGLVTGDNFTVNFATPWSSNLVGAHIIRTIIDSDKQIEESNEVNNEATRAVIVGAAANLYFQVFQPSVSSPALGQSINITARIGNNGDEAIDAAVIFYFINSLGDTVQIGVRSLSLNGHDSVTINLPWTVVNNNTTLVAKIVNGSIMEFNYEDNMATAPLGGFEVSLTATPACAGKPTGTLTPSITGGTGPFSYQWSNGAISPTLTAGPGSYSVRITDANGVFKITSGTIPNIPGQRYYADADGDGYGNPLKDSIDCQPPAGYVLNKLDCNDANPLVYKTTPTPQISVSGNLVFCLGNSVGLSVDSILGITHTWSNGLLGHSIRVFNSDTLTVTASQDSGCVATSNSIITEAVDQIVPRASITLNTDTIICTGTAVTFTAQASGGGDVPAFEWYLNNVFVADGLTYQTDTLKNGDRVQFILTSSETCANPVLVFSNRIRMTVQTAIQANAGPDQEICGNQSQLQGNLSGTWAVLSGTGIVANPGSAITQVSQLSTGDNEFIWTLQAGTCPSTSDTVNIRVLPAATPAQAGPDQNICSDSALVQANVPQLGSGTWTLLSGTGDIGDANAAGTTIRNLSLGLNQFVWTIANGNCPASSDTLNIVRETPPSVAVAGADQTLCGDQTSLAADLPATGTGAWSVLSGAGIIANSNDANSSVSGLSLGENIFVWAVSNGSCTPSTDTVVVTVNPFPTTAQAGPDQTLCADSALVQANVPQLGSGTWTLLSGTGDIGDANAAGTIIRNLSLGLNQFVWTIANGNCPASSDTLSIVRETPPSVAVAGADQTLCGDQTSLAAEVPATGTGAWSVLSGSGIIANSNDANSSVSGLSLGENIFVWTVSNGSCTPSTDTVVVTVNPFPTPAQAGPDQTLCADSALVQANVPQLGSGTWTLLSGTGDIEAANAAGTIIRNLGVGLNQFVWTIANGNCPASSDTLNIVRETPPSVAVAGADQTLCGDQTSLAAEVPASGAGAWSVLSGAGIIANSNDANSSVSGLSLGENIFVWTVSNGSCTPSTDTVRILTFEPLVANAGLNQTVCGPIATLGAQSIPSGNGLWTVVSGSGTFANETDPTTQVSGLTPGPNIFKWKVNNNTCPADSALVTITSVESPSMAQAGPSQSVCGTTVQLDAVQPAVGTGVWQLIAGSGVIADSLAANTTVTQLSLGANTFRWTVKNAPCPSSSADVVITANEIPVANAGPDKPACGGQVLLTAVSQGGATGFWTQLSGTGTILEPNSDTTLVVNMSSPVNQFIWTALLGSCSAKDTLNVEVVPNLLNLGPDTVICQDSTLTIAAGSGYSSYLWNTNQTSETITVNTAGVYWVEVSTISGCIFRDSISVVTAPCVSNLPLLGAQLDWTLFPNPAKTKLNIVFRNIGPEFTSLNVINALGKTVLTKELSPTQSLWEESLELDLPNGMYYLEVQSKRLQASEKFMIFR